MMCVAQNSVFHKVMSEAKLLYKNEMFVTLSVYPIRNENIS